MEKTNQLLMAIYLLITGTYETKVDYKNRLTIPRDIFRIMNCHQRGIDGCFVSNYGSPKESCYTVLTPIALSLYDSQLPLFYFRKIDKKHRILLPDKTLVGQMVKIIGDGDKFLIQKINNPKD